MEMKNNICLNCSAEFLLIFLFLIAEGFAVSLIEMLTQFWSMAEIQQKLLTSSNFYFISVFDTKLSSRSNYLLSAVY